MISRLRLLLVDAFTAFTWRIPLLVALLVLSGLLEGLAITAALPLLGSFAGEGGASQAKSEGSFISLLSHLPATLGLPDGVVGAGSLIVAFVFASALAFIAQARLAALLQARYVLRWQTRLFEAVLAAGPRFVETRRGGDIVAALVTDSSRVSGAFYHTCLVLTAFINLAIYLVLALLISPLVSLAIIVLGGVLLVATRTFLARAYGYGEGITAAQADVQAIAGEIVSQIKAVKAAAAERSAGDTFGEATERLAHLNFKNSFDIQKAKAVFEFGGAVGVACILIAGPLFFAIGIAEVIVILALFVRLLPRITALQQGLQALSALLPALANLRTLVADAGFHAEPADLRSLPPQIATAAPDIQFSGVRILRGGRCVLDHIDLIIPAGRIVAFVGSSGSGKSTLVDALLGLVPLDGGKICIAGLDLADLPMPAWRRAVGYVGQEAALLSGTIATNVRFGTAAGVDAVDRALRRAAAQFVFRFSSGIDTPVGDRGTRLSGGERQRIGIARSIVVSRSLYILDEATSALDSETEAEVIEMISSLAGKATIIVIAHRFTAVTRADAIHVLEGGRIVESGDWASLDRPGTRFFALKHLQDMTGSDQPR